MNSTGIERFYFSDREEVTSFEKNDQTVSILLIEDEQAKINEIMRWIRKLPFASKILIAVSSHIFTANSSNANNIINLILETIDLDKPDIVILDLSWSNESEIFDELKESRDIRETLKNKGKPKVLNFFDTILNQDVDPKKPKNLKKIPFIIWTQYNKSYIKLFENLYKNRMEYYLIEKDDLENLQKVVTKSLIFNQVTRKHPIYVASPSQTNIELIFLVEKASKVSSSILITGGTGTGKEYTAKLIHNLSSRQENDIVSINCGAIPKELIESELFGYEIGAFTGAVRQKPGLLELANGGTLFLDEIGEMSKDVQVKLLRAIQERKIQRLGGNKFIDIDVRIIAATNKNLEEEIRSGNFREDLYYRLHVIEIKLPSLSEDKSNIDLLTECYIREIVDENPESNFEDRIELIKNQIKFLYAYDFPGNKRQLKNIIENFLVTENSMSQILSEQFRKSDEEISDKELIHKLYNKFIARADKNLKNFTKELSYEIILEAIRRVKEKGGIQQDAAALFNMNGHEFSNYKKRLAKDIGRKDNEND